MTEREAVLPIVIETPAEYRDQAAPLPHVRTLEAVDEPIKLVPLHNYR